ncbi:MAG TPA: Fur family transcriptional regulator [Methylomirabilota bacterium]|nr:Fur family transcriptional regulator [Methylomirabilota bacterium]
MVLIPDESPVARRRVGAAAALRGVGLRLTAPRRLVLEVVRGSNAHPTAEAVHQMVRCRLPRVSLGTVYRNLRVLVAQGLVKELPGPHTRFDCNLSDHHHFICLACGRITDVAGALTERYSRPLVSRVASSGGFSVTHHQIEFYGRCATCRRKGRRAVRRPPP